MTDVASTPTAPTGPWANDVAATFTDPEVAAAVSKFLGEKVQPYVTRKEQEVTELGAARELYDDLISDPGNTWLALTSEIFGEERADAILTAYHSAIEGGATHQEAQQEAQQVAEETEPNQQQQPVIPPVSALSDEDRAAIDEIKQEKARKAYNKAVDEFITEQEDEGLVKDLFHTHIAAAGGDLDVAYETYKRERAHWQPPAEGEQEQPAPTVIGSEAQSAASSETPTLPKAQSISEAIDDLFTDVSAPAPPTVGTV